MMKENQLTPPIDTNQYRGMLPSRSAQLTETQWYAKTSSVLLIVGAILSVLTWIAATFQSSIRGIDGSGSFTISFPTVTPPLAITMVAIWVGMHTSYRNKKRNTLVVGVITFAAMLFSIVESLFLSAISAWAYFHGGDYSWIKDIMRIVNDGIKLTALVVFALLIAYIVCYINERRQENLFQQQVVKGEMNE